MLVNYIIIAHKGAKQLERLIKRLNGPDVFFYVHIDRSSDIESFQVPFINFKNVYFLEGKERKSSPWADIGSVTATLTALKRCVENTSSKAYCVLLSGQDYPLKSNVAIRSFFASNYGKNFISIAEVADMWPTWKTRYERYNFHLPKKRSEMGIYPYTDHRFYSISNVKNILSVSMHFGVGRTFKTVFNPTRKHPLLLSKKGGSAWWAFPVETVSQLLDYFDNHPEVLRYHEFTHVPDETIFHSIINEIKPADEIEESVTYVNWEQKGVSSPVTFKTSDDLKELLALDANFLYARKFDSTKSSEILDNLDALVLKKSL